ncbi:glycosyltransferase family 2 protein [Terriglobus aquaticus]|uniref:Glycosyltransferase family 2 protein n=1 Tax=Terriglobus aquaticus TaxID=940139 RepID=A0ABW9KPQ7_9BACT|nr:glycosyltransferase family 2 protein [Terriglobus aquaticus]
MSTGSAPSICVALVTFNRKHLLVECIDALLQQTHPVDRIFVIDNGSTDGTADLLRERGYLQNDRITLAREETNSGGAGGFHRGLQLGQQAGFDWIWLMDDDAEPAPDALQQALAASANTSAIAIANFKVSAEGVPQDNHMRLENGVAASTLAGTASPVPLRFSSFVGLLIRSAVIPQVGLPRAEFFLNGDDTEYCMRLRKAGPILLAPASIIRHKEAARSGYAERSFLGVRHARAPFRAFAFRYFELRNTTIIHRIEHGTLSALIFALRRVVALSAAILAFRDDRPLQRIRLVVKAHADAFRGNFDNGFPFRLLRQTSA